MRMWMVDVRKMCRKHLLGEHVECHMIAASVRDGRSLDGYVDSNALQLKSLVVRHAALSREMLRRGYRHRSPLLTLSWNIEISRKAWASRVSLSASRAELHRRCQECREMALGKISK